MVKEKMHAENPETWLAHVAKLREKDDLGILKSAISLGAGDNPQLLKRGLGIADILLGLELDNETLAAAIIYPAFQAHQIHHDIAAEHFGDRVKKMLRDALQMQSLDRFQKVSDRDNSQIENLRKILLAMVTDIRAVLIILAERLWELRQAKLLEPAAQKKLAQQTLKIHAPLANRLGVWQLKWEMEDLCLRYMEPETYKEIAHSLATKRDEREHYLNEAIQTLTDLLNKHQIKQFKVTGRVKHIYSIQAKMRKKVTSFNKIYDISAMRVLVPEIEDCYTVMGILHHTWQQVPEEFDDYIDQPKANNYQSIHTVIIGPEERAIEVQIRTYKMHEESELGVASHWRYKEGSPSASNYEEKIALLRQIMAWQKEIVAEPDKKPDSQIKDLFADQVYVFTPLGDVIDLPKGATPLDFAYSVHSEVGHRCRGAKVNGKMVQLTYQLQTGERVEILTAKQANPSRDWLNPHKEYIKTSRARSHIQHWFREKDNVDKEPIGEHTKTSTKRKPKLHDVRAINKTPVISVSNLLTKFARCCKPLPGDTVIGYITQKQGLSIHRMDCKNILHLKGNNHDRFIEVNLGDKFINAHPVDLEITGTADTKLLTHITNTLANIHVHIVSISAMSYHQDGSTYMLTIHIKEISDLQKTIHALNQLPDVLQVKRL